MDVSTHNNTQLKIRFLHLIVCSYLQNESKASSSADPTSYEHKIVVVELNLNKVDYVLLLYADHMLRIKHLDFQRN